MQNDTEILFGAKRVCIIAELSANHHHDFDLTVKTLEAMARAGADAVKVQTFTPDSLTIDVDNEYFGPRTEGLWKGSVPYELFREAMMPWEWQPKLKQIAEKLGMYFFSSPFDVAAVDFLEKMDVPAYKVASLEISDIPLITHIAKKGKPVIISTGAAGLSDIDLALQTCRDVGNQQLALLKCTSAYPASPADANLLTIPNLRDTFNVVAGLSDHTMGSTVPVAAVALGARIVEKHFILSREQGGPDAAFSMEPDEFAAMVSALRDTEAALGQINYQLSDKDRLRRRSLFAVRDIEAGTPITGENVRSVRPGHGLHPKYYAAILGKTARKKIPKGSPVTLDLIDH